MSTQIAQVRAAATKLQHDLGREPTADEISSVLEMPIEDIKRILLLRHVPFSLDEAVGRDQDNKLSDLMLGPINGRSG